MRNEIRAKVAREREEKEQEKHLAWARSLVAAEEAMWHDAAANTERRVVEEDVLAAIEGNETDLLAVAPTGGSSPGAGSPSLAHPRCSRAGEAEQSRDQVSIPTIAVMENMCGSTVKVPAFGSAPARPHVPPQGAPGGFGQLGY